jgi:hypothetical protein
MEEEKDKFDDFYDKILVLEKNITLDDVLDNEEFRKAFKNFCKTENCEGKNNL